MTVEGVCTIFAEGSFPLRGTGMMCDGVARTGVLSPAIIVKESTSHAKHSGVVWDTGIPVADADTDQTLGEGD